MILAIHEQTIIAQCTPKGSGAIGLLRISGKHTFEITQKIARLKHNKTILTSKSHTIAYGHIIDTDATLVDQVLFFLMRGPHTFTGEDTIEISCHNNPFIIEKIIECTINAGARLAQPGEFSKRAFLNKKIDLIQAEAINEVIHASNQQSLKLSLSQLEGSLSSWISNLEQEVVKCFALSEASFEHLDEEDLEFNNQIKDTLQTVLETLSSIKKTFNQQQHIRNGIRIALIGSVNAGKSSLFNQLIGSNRAIVTNIAGTTRDVIEAGMYKFGTYITMIDTAGLRQTDDVIEHEGIQRSYQEASKADIILLVCDSSASLSEQEKSVYKELFEQFQSKIVVVEHKIDQKQSMLSIPTTSIATSVKQPETIKDLQKAIQKKIEAILASANSPYLLNERHYQLLSTLEQKVKTIIPMLDHPEYELISIHLNDTLQALSELTGKSVSRKAMDMLFKQFCVGK